MAYADSDAVEWSGGGGVYDNRNDERSFCEHVLTKLTSSSYHYSQVKQNHNQSYLKLKCIIHDKMKKRRRCALKYLDLYGDDVDPPQSWLH